MNVVARPFPRVFARALVRLTQNSGARTKPSLEPVSQPCLLRSVHTPATRFETSTMAQREEFVVLFDGVCNLCVLRLQILLSAIRTTYNLCRCAGVVQFILANDSNKVFSFCSLQSQAAQPLIKACGIPQEEVMNSFVLVRRQPGFLPEEGVASDKFTYYRASTAALQIGSRLDRPFSLLAPVALYIPAPLRDAVYYCVARNRYSVFGKSESCMMPTKALRKRFLDWGEDAAPAAAASGGGGAPGATESMPPAARSRSQGRKR